MSSLGLRTARLGLRAGAIAIPPRALSGRTFSAISRVSPLTPAARTASLLARRPQPFVRRFNSTTASGPSSSSSHSSGSSGSSSSSNPGPDPTKSAYQRFKDLTKTYGSYAIIMYLALSAVDFSLAFAIVHTVGVSRIEPYTHQLKRWYRVTRYGKEGADALDAADAARQLAVEAEEAADVALAGGKKQSAWWSNKALWAEVALAYSIHKVGFLPLRAGLTVAWTPKVVNFLRARGWIGTSGAKRAVQHGKDRVRDAGQRALQQAKDATSRGPK